MVLKKEGSKLTKKMKVLIASIVVILLIAVTAIVYFTNSVAINNYVLYMFMPKTITGEQMDTNYDLHVRLNEKYDADTQSNQPLEAYEYYYTDPQSGEEVVITGAKDAEINGEKVPIYLGFLIEAKNNLDTFTSIFSKVIAVLVVVLIAVGIVLWYKSWSRREDEAKAKTYKANNRAKK